MLTFHAIHPNNKAPRCADCGEEAVGHYVVGGGDDDPDHDCPIQYWLCEVCNRIHRLREIIEKTRDELMAAVCITAGKYQDECLDGIISGLTKALEEE